MVLYCFASLSVLSTTSDVIMAIYALMWIEHGRLNGLILMEVLETGNVNMN